MVQIVADSFATNPAGAPLMCAASKVTCSADASPMPDDDGAYARLSWY